MGTERRSQPLFPGLQISGTAERRAKIGLAAEVLGMYARVRWLVVRHGAVPAVSVLRRGLNGGAGASGHDRMRVERGWRLGRAVTRVLRVLPADSRCLMRSLVLTGLLARRGVHATVVIGVRPAPEFGAHAWVEVDGVPVLATDEVVYRRLVEI